MTKVKEKQVRRLKITDENPVGMNCGAFIDFFHNQKIKGCVLERARNFDEYITNNENALSTIIKAPSCGLKCNMIFGVCVNPDWYEKTEKDSDEGKIKFSQSLFKKTMLEVFTECFKNCVDSIVVNTKELKKMLENTRIKNPHVEIMAALKSFYIGEVIDESGHQHSKRFVGKITIVCSDENEVKAYEHQKSNFGNLEPDPYVILDKQKSKDTMEKEDVKKQITSRKEYVNHEVSQVKSHLSLLEGHSTEYCHWEKQHYHSLIDTQLNECDEPVVGASLHTLETCVDMYQTLLIQYDKLLDEQKKLNGDKK